MKSGRLKLKAVLLKTRFASPRIGERHALDRTGSQIRLRAKRQTCGRQRSDRRDASTAQYDRLRGAEAVVNDHQRPTERTHGGWGEVDVDTAALTLWQHRAARVGKPGRGLRETRAHKN